MITHKRGSYFGYLVKASDADNLDADFTGAKVRCKIKTLAGALVHNFGELALAADGTALLEVQPEISITWPAGMHKTDFVYVDDVVDIVDWLLATPEVSGVFNAGSGQARSFVDLARATFAAAGKAPSIAYVDMPEAIRDRYQYFTEARMDALVRLLKDKKGIDVENDPEFAPAVLAHAASILVAHNHPSGDPRPSEEDNNLTRVLVETGNIMGIPVLDHLIIGDGRYYSYKEHGKL